MPWFLLVQFSGLKLSRKGLMRCRLYRAWQTLYIARRELVCWYVDPRTTEYCWWYLSCKRRQTWIRTLAPTPQRNRPVPSWCQRTLSCAHQSRGCASNFAEPNGLSMFNVGSSRCMMRCLRKWFSVHGCPPVLWKIWTAACGCQPSRVIRVKPSFKTLSLCSVASRPSTRAPAGLNSREVKTISISTLYF